jgi:hypothetical protein
MREYNQKRKLTDYMGRCIPTIKSVVLSAALGMFSCQQQPTRPNTITEEERKDGWMLLFDGQTTKGWHVYNEGPVLSVWSVQQGELVCDPAAKGVAFGDLVTDLAYGNFAFRFEWKITKGGNSGVFFNVQEDTAFATAWTTGPEYQLLDNLNVTDHNRNDPKRQAGCLYSLADLKNDAKPKPFGEWNQSEIRQDHGRVTFWLNGVLSAEENLNSDRWKELVAASSLGKFPMFGKATKGKIALQNWAKGVSFRNLKLKLLPG